MSVNDKENGNGHGNYWDALAQHYRYQQPPLRPCAEDVRIIHQTICDWSRLHPTARTSAVLLGVTPELAGLAWPAETRLLAVDRSRAMIDAIWTGDVPDRRQVVQGDWFGVDVAEASLDFVVGDGFLTAFAYPMQHAQLAEVISRWLKPDGLMIARLFVRPSRKETLQEIVSDLEANRVAQFDALRWRLAMALQENAERGVVLDEVYRAWRDIEQTLPGVSERAGWPASTVDTIGLYEGRTERYAFPTVEELHRAFSSCLEPLSVTIPGYEMGERCPILVYRPRVSGRAAS